MNFLPYLSFFVFLFNIFWSEPVRILSKEYELGHYYLTSPLLIASAVLAAALALISVFLPKKIKYITQGPVAYLLIATALYSVVAPYDYGGFTSNEIFRTMRPLLGFSRWYYLLDAGILLLSAAACVFLFKRKLQNALFGFFLFYYVSQSFFQFQASRFTGEPVKFSSITLSENHTNVLYLIYDTTPSIAVEHMIEKVWNQQQKEWTKDFTLYDNTAAVGVGSTPSGLPTIFGGYQFSPQKQLARADSGEITEDIFNSPQYQERHRLFPPQGAGFFFSAESLEYLASLLPNVDIRYEGLGMEQFFPETNFSSRTAKDPTYPSLPLAGVALYGRSPYFLRWIFAKPEDATLWKNTWHLKAGWMQAKSKSTKFFIKETERPTLNFIHSFGIHSLMRKKDLESVITEMMAPLNDIISHMKEKNIYDRTKIIISSDHGSSANDFLYSIASPQMQKFYEKDTELEDLVAFEIPSLCMIKDFAAGQTEMARDSRLISLADMHGVMLNAFGNTTVPDYTSPSPPSKGRMFNIPYIRWQYIHSLVRKDLPDMYKGPQYAPRNLYLEVHSVKEGEIYVRKLKNTNEASQVPVVEWIE